MNKSTKIGSALVVVGGSLAAAPASALELGELTVHSALGQPLRASISYALGPNESVADTCVTIQRVQGGTVPSIDKGSLNVAGGVIAISRGSVVSEPVVSLRVSVRCPYTPRLTRDYLLLVDPPEFATAPVEAPVPESVASGPLLVAPPVRRPAPRPVSREPISPESRYLVQPGDSLSRIAQRIEGAPSGWREISTSLFNTNPDAFMANDPNRLKAGSWLTIPAFDGVTVEAPTDIEPQPVYEPTVVDPVVTTAYEPGMVEATPPVAETAAELIDEIPEPDIVEPQNELRPGDLIVDATVSIPDTQVDAVPETTSTSPNGSIAIIRQPARPETQGTNWLLWIGGGIAALLGLAFLGRVFRDRFGSAPIAPAKPKTQPPAENTERVEAIADVDLDFGTGSLLGDDSPTAENLQLDADLIVGTGLSETADVDVATDFSFAATTELDIELTEEMSEKPEAPETDIIPPINADESSILKGEILPEDEENEDDDEYDMSVIIDATKMPDPSDVTERDLEAVAVDDSDDTLITDDYTVSQDVDYNVLEQDYEDEMTATQALNEEIQKAAEDLAVNLDEADANISDTDINAHGTVGDLDVTAQMPANDDGSLSDDDDTGINPTIEMDAGGDTVEMPKKGKKAS